MDEGAAPPVSSDWRRMIAIGFAVIFFSFFVLGGWAAMARLDAAVVARGTISVESYRKTVQHLEGGIVSEILVRDGDLVQEGDVLVRLDPTRDEAKAAAYRQQLATALVLEARLTAQREMKEQISFPKEVMDNAKDQQVAEAIDDNRSQFENRRATLKKAIGVTERQIAQAKKEIDQEAVNERTAKQQIDNMNIELPNLRRLLARGLVAVPRVTTLERQLMAVEGVRDNARLSVEKGHSRVAEFEARIDQLRQEYRQEAANQLPEVQRTIGDIRQQLVIADDLLRRIEIKAPVAGTVQQMRIYTVGGVIKPGDPILDIVPVADSLVVRAKISPYDRDRVREGEAVEVRIPQFSLYMLAPIGARLRSVSHDSLLDEVTREPYFAGEVVVEKSSIPHEIVDKLTAGMQVDVVIPTEERTVLVYLLGPMVYRLALSMRER